MGRLDAPHDKPVFTRIGHPTMRELVGGLELSLSTLLRRDDASTFAQMLANAEYWLSFDVAAFEPMLSKSPSPLRELGVAIALRFSECMDGGLTLSDLDRARQMIGLLATDLKEGVEEGLRTLERAVKARESIPALEQQGFRPYVVTPALSVHALRAMGKSHIEIVGHGTEERKVEVRFGEPITLASTDERGRPLSPPEVESHVEAPLYVREDSENQRTIFLLVPGEYFVRVPGRATGERKLIAL
jgi:hypothetical protein